MINILKKDEKYFNKNLSHTTLTGYYKTKDNGLRIAIFEDGTFVAFETPKAEGIFKKFVLEQDTNKFILENTTPTYKKDGSIEHITFIGKIND